jgi:hypothetical protein
MIVCLALRLQGNVIEHRRLHFGQLPMCPERTFDLMVAGRELKDLLTLLNIKHFSRTPESCRRS